MKYDHTRKKLTEAEMHDGGSMAAVITHASREGADDVYSLSLEVHGMSDRLVVSALGHIVRYLIRERHLTFRLIMESIFSIVDTGRTELEELQRLRDMEAGGEPDEPPWKSKGKTS